MGSVSSLVSGHRLHNKHCQAEDYKVRKASHKRKTARSLDGLLKYSFAQGSSAHTAKVIPRAGKSEDFFYIKVNHEPQTTRHWGLEHVGDSNNMEADIRVAPMSGERKQNIEKSLIRPTAFKPVIPRSTSSTEAGSDLIHLLSPPEMNGDTPGPRQDSCPSTLSDSGQESMSSLPSPSTGGSLLAATGPVTQSAGVSAHSMTHPLQLLSTWTNGNGVAARPVAPGRGVAGKADRDTVSLLDPQPPSPLLEEMGCCNRSPISTDQSLVELLELRLLERESELQELQVSFEEKEEGTCNLFAERQRYCVEEMEGLKRRCSTKLRQASQRVMEGQQALQLQVSQLQQDKQRLRDELARMTQEKELTEAKLKSFETEKTQVEPALEEARWELCQKTGEISLLKQQLRDSQADVTHKLNDVVSLKASLKETRAKMGALEQEKGVLEERICSRSADVKACQSGLQRKKNEADLLSAKVGILETDIQEMKKDLAMAKEQRQQQTTRLEARGQERADQTGGSTNFLQREVERLKVELRNEKDTQERLTNSFERERQTWNREKDRVIKYQNQLQLNYLQTHKKNRDLERILRELTVELESRPELDVDFHSSVLHYEDIIATEI